MTGTEIYKRTATYERDAATLRLHVPQWKLLLAFDGRRSLAEVALSAALSFAESLPLVETFLDRQWIEEQPITLDQYLQRAGASEISTPGTAIPPAVILHEPRPAVAPPPIPTPATSAATPAALPIAPAPVSGSSPGPMRLSAVVDYVTSLVGHTALGRLLVYRVFLRVPPELLQAESIVSVHLVNDTTLIRSDALQKAIVAAVAEIVQRPLPDGVFAAA